MVVAGLEERVVDGVLWLTIDRPERKNALSLAMRQRIVAVAGEVDDTPDVAAVVLTGAGELFTAGVDLKEISAADGPVPPTDPGAALRSIGKPVICAVNGRCVTGGLELALGCDLIVASDRAAFRDTHARIGVLPRYGLSALLPRRVGIARAKEITLTGRWVDADEAHRIGLVNHVWPHDELASRTAELVADIVSCDPAAARASLDLYDRGDGLGLAEALQLETEVSGAWVTDAGTLGDRIPPAP